MTGAPTPLGIYHSICGTLRQRGERACSVSVVGEAAQRGYHGQNLHDILRCHERLTLAGGPDLDEARRLIRAGFTAADILDAVQANNLDAVNEHLEMALGAYPSMRNICLHLESRGFSKAHAKRTAVACVRRYARGPA